MNLIAKYLLGYLVIHILLISVVQAFFCQDLKIIELVLGVVAFGIAILNSKKITLEKSEIIIVFLLVFLNIYYIFIDLKGLIYFKMTYVLVLGIILSKVILPNISLKKYFEKINLLYFIILVGLVIEYLLVAMFGNKLLVDLLMCNGVQTGVRGYIELYNMTREILPYHIHGLNSIMLAQQGGQTASQLAIIISIWYFYKYKDNKNRVDLSLALLAVLMVFLSPSITAFFLLFTSLIIFYLVYLKSILHEKVNSFYQMFFVIFISIFFIFLLFKVLTAKHNSMDYIFEVYVLGSISGLSNFNLKEILFGVSYERELELFKLGEISYITHIIKYGLVGVGVFYGSILYFILKALTNKTLQSIVPNIFIIVIFILGNTHYPVMFVIGVIELFILHLAYIIYVGSIEKNSNKS